MLVDTYPDFRIDAAKVAAAITAADQVRDRQHARPTRPGVVASADEMQGPGRALPASGTSCSISDEVYRAFCYDRPFATPGDLERGRPGRRRLQQVPRHDRLAARLRPRPVAG